MVRPYYIVYTLVKNEKNTYPMFVTCTEIKGKYFRIDNLEAYFKKEGGITDEEIIADTAFLINDYDWESRFRLHYRR